MLCSLSYILTTTRTTRVPAVVPPTHHEVEKVNPSGGRVYSIQWHFSSGGLPRKKKINGNDVNVCGWHGLI